ncbi:protein yippee-like 1 isoform X2 [Eubalaena glacialis]|uniref:protein yippee-like 1 isoform X2 n=1 Tax=Eubalaena glacialis TaxID=27606 RepID=UPI002A5A621A|nr:protein yippee-like 1 isoform X2 [Eubalaena glacialis]
MGAAGRGADRRAAERNFWNPECCFWPKNLPHTNIFVGWWLLPKPKGHSGCSRSEARDAFHLRLWRFSLTPAVWTEPHALQTTTALACMFQCFFCQRAQQSCSSSRASPELSQECPAEMVKMTRSKTFQAYLPNCHRTYSCVHCRAHLANHDELISKSFQGSQGRAYLFNSVVNVGCGPAEERVLLTGLHAVADIYCENCKTTLGWKYEHAFESSQKYKEGKFIIELAHMIKDNGWE